MDQAGAQYGPNPAVDYTKPNVAYSPPLHKFVDSLPGLNAPNNLGQQIPVATAGVLPGFPNDEYYEIALVEYREQMHSDLPPLSPAGAYDPTALNAALPLAYVASQPPPVVPQTAYPAPWTAATNTYSTIQANSLTFKDVAGDTVTMPFQPKAIQELFDDFGRMNAILGTELPFTSALIQTTIPLAYIDPPTETFTPSQAELAAVPAGQTQIWKITHNGVDTHAIHFHLVNGKEFDSSHRRGQPTTLKVGGVIRGWQEALQLMPVGSTWQLFIPSQLAYERSRAHEESNPGGCGLCLRFAVQSCHGGDL